MSKQFLLKFPMTEKPITLNKILPLACLIDISNKCEDEKTKKALRKVIHEKIGKVSFEEVVVEWYHHDFPLKPILDAYLENEED